VTEIGGDTPKVSFQRFLGYRSFSIRLYPCRFERFIERTGDSDVDVRAIGSFLLE